MRYKWPISSHPKQVCTLFFSSLFPHRSKPGQSIWLQLSPDRKFYSFCRKKSQKFAREKCAFLPKCCTMALAASKLCCWQENARMYPQCAQSFRLPAYPLVKIASSLRNSGWTPSFFRWISRPSHTVRHCKLLIQNGKREAFLMILMARKTFHLPLCLLCAKLCQTLDIRVAQIPVWHLCTTTIELIYRLFSSG